MYVREVLAMVDMSEQGKEDFVDHKKNIRIMMLQDNKTSISYLQRKFHCGYNEASIFIEALEDEGFLSPPDKNGKRVILEK